ncbi:MAG: hypothetical protein AAB573_04830 [Patescibacteria group bacterium]
MNDRRSIQDIIPPARSRPVRPQVTPVMSEEAQPPHPTQPPLPPRMSRSRSGGGALPFIWVALITVIVLASIVGLMSTVFHSADVTVTVSEWKSDISGTYDAGGESSLAYTPLVIADQRTKSVPATGSEEAKVRAEGVITIYNAYSTKTQRLITNTRFESPSGKIYRIHAPVVVPGYVLVNGAKVPGQITAQVYADEPGPEYNTGPTEFTIPGLKGTPQFKDTYARSTDAISGGFIGQRAVVDKAVRDEAVLALKAELDRALRDAIGTKTPAGMTVFPDSALVTFREGQDTADGDNALLTVNGNLEAPMFVAEDLARILAEKVSIDTSLSLTLKNPSEIGFTNTASSTYQPGSPFSFALSGIGNIGLIFDPEELKTRIAGKGRAELESVRREYPGIQSLSVTVYPFWLSTIPSEGGIDVEVISALDRTR